MPAKRTKRTIKPNVEKRSSSRIIGEPMTDEEIQAQMTRSSMGSPEEIAERIYAESKARRGKQVTRKKALEMATKYIEDSVTVEIDNMHYYKRIAAKRRSGKIDKYLFIYLPAVLWLTGVSYAFWWITTGQFKD